VRQEEAMKRKLQAIVLLMCTITYAVASTVSIGTVSARGDMRIDGNKVNGNATLFDGSVVETGTATADLRLAKGVQLTLSPNSRTTLHSDHLLLERGATEMSGASTFKVEANGLTVAPLESHSRAVISMKTADTMEVATLDGSFGIRNIQGDLISTVRPGRSLLFAKQTGSVHTSFSGVGTVSVDKDGYYFFFTEQGGTFQLVGKDLKEFLGYEVKVTGTVQPGVKPVITATEVVSVNTIKKIDTAAAEGNSHKALIVSGVIVVSSAGIAVGVFGTSQNKNSASP
jgi:hypothetical protein